MTSNFNILLFSVTETNKASLSDFRFRISDFGFMNRSEPPVVAGGLKSNNRAAEIKPSAAADGSELWILDFGFVNLET